MFITCEGVPRLSSSAILKEIPVKHPNDKWIKVINLLINVIEIKGKYNTVNSAQVKSTGTEEIAST